MKYLSFVSAFVFLLVFSCNGSDKKQSESKNIKNKVVKKNTKTKTAEKKSAEKKTAEKKSEKAGKTTSVFKLIDAGKDPKQVLKYKFNMNTSRYRMKFNMNMVIQMQGKTHNTQTPETSYVIVTKPLKIKKNGNIVFKQSFEDLKVVNNVKLPAAQFAQYKQNVAPILKMTIVSEMTDSGESLNSKLDIPKNMPPSTAGLIKQMNDQIKDLVMRFPKKPVGIGAKWSITKNVVSNGIKMNVSTVYVLNELKGDDVKISAESVIKAAPQTITTKGISVNIKSISGGAKNKSVLNLKELLSNNEIRSIVKQELESNGQTMKMAIGFFIKVAKIK